MKLRNAWRKAALLCAAALMISQTALARTEEETMQQFSFSTGSMAKKVQPSDLKQITEAQAAEIDALMQEYVPADNTLLRNQAEVFYYYENLGPAAKEIYDVMLMIAEDPAAEGNYGVMMTDLDPESDEFFYEYLCAYYAMTYDHPELFWLYNCSMTSIGLFSDVMSTMGLYLVYFGLTSPYTEYESQMTAFNQAAEEFLAEIDTTRSEYEIALQIHDKLIQMVTYDNAVCENMQAQASNLAHTAYGALVADSEGLAHYAVCDGYALAYEYLLQQCQIEAVVVAGEAGLNEDSLGGHAWNLVKLDGVWYEADVTWDDCLESFEEALTPDINGYEYYYEALHDTVYQDKLQHYLFLLSTENIRNFVPDESCYYTTQDQLYRFCLLSESVHIRSEDNGTKEFTNADPYVLSLAPVAGYNY